MKFERDQRNLLGVFDLMSVNLDDEEIGENVQFLVYRDFITIDEIGLLIPFSKIKTIDEVSRSKELILRIDYKEGENLKSLRIKGKNDGSPDSLEYCEIMVERGIMSSHIPLKNKDKACYGVLGY